jgi:hypothetical protein
MTLEPGNAFQPEDLEALEQAFEQTWAVLALDPSRNSSNDEALKAAIRQKLMTIAAAGLIDVEMMRKMVLESLARSDS